MMIMPYDPRPISEGGNRGIEEASREPPQREVPHCWCGHLDEAKEFVAVEVKKNPQMLMIHVYDHGKHVHNGGSF
jgi:hypothetical protein